MSSFLTFHVPPSELGKKLPHLQILSSDTAAPEAGLDSSAAPFTDGFFRRFYFLRLGEV